MPSNALLNYPFRTFFFLVGSFGALAMLAWVAIISGGMQLPVGWSPFHWHSHEMLFGLVSAAISGFLLTAMCNWTGAKALHGRHLLALALLWLAGRLVMALASWLPMAVVSLVDLAYFPVLGIYVLRVLLRYNNRRNLILAAILLLLGIANLLMHIGFWQRDISLLQQGENMALTLITLVMIVIGGRITPAFSGNWLRMHGQSADGVRILPRLEQAVLISTALLIPADFFAAKAPWLVTVLALVAATLNGIRLFHWQGWKVTQEPLLWVLHLAYSWIVIALLLKGLASMGLVSAAAWQHALGVGGMGMLILGVMTRVALGHSGRPMRLPPKVSWLYLAILVAVIARVLVALQVLNYGFGIVLAASAWILAYGGFTLIYWPILSQPRADGRPG